MKPEPIRVGARVRVVKDEDGPFAHGYLGRVGEIVEQAEANPLFPVTVQFDNGEQCDFAPDELEVVEP